MEDNIIEEELDDTDSEDELDMLRNLFVGGGLNLNQTGLNLMIHVIKMMN